MMKYAVFEFIEDKSCEIGETSWISGEDNDTFTNDEWFFNKEVVVQWPKPKDAARVLKCLSKNIPVDIDEFDTKRHPARVVKFGDDYEGMGECLKQYLKTGTTATPSHGRGQRVPKRNGRFISSDEDSEGGDEPLSPVLPKKQKTKHTAARKLDKHMLKTGVHAELDKLKKKYNFSAADSDKFQVSESYDDDETTRLRQIIEVLEKKLNDKEREVEQLQHVIKNIKDLPSLESIVAVLKKQVDVLQCKVVKVNPAGPSSASSSPVSIRSSSSGSDIDVLNNDVTICEHVVLSKGQSDVLKSKKSLKDFVYTIMGMLWTREVLATHSITGKSSNAFKDREPKPRLDEEKIESICECAQKRFGSTEAEVKHVMKSKLSNIAKAFKLQQKNITE